jgi:Amidohydrolase family
LQSENEDFYFVALGPRSGRGRRRWGIYGRTLINLSEVEIVVKYFIQTIVLLSVLTTPVVAENYLYDIAIVGGRVVDPETKLNAVRNVGIKGNQIIVVTQDSISAPKIIDASGLIVSPGFIDMHAHGQTIPAASMQALDGVTTGLELEAGVLPVSDYYEQVAKEGRPINYGASVNWASARIGAFVNKTPENSPEWFMDHFNVPGWQKEIATEAQLKKILAMVQTGLDEGGLGVGFLLGYAPGTGHKEYYKVTELAAKRAMPTFTHARFLSMLEPESSFEGMAEIISAAAGTGVQAHIVHINSISQRDINAIANMVSGAQASGVKISTEAYPYGAGSTGIGSAMFRGPNWRERTGISARSFEVDGKRLTDKELTHLQSTAPETGSIIHFLDLSISTDQAFLDKAVLFPGGVIASDGGDWLVDGKALSRGTWPIPENARSHPRSAGTYSRFLRRYVRETKSVSLLEAIRRVSYGPAKILQESIPQMKKKGRIQVGADADITIFDLATVTDKATYAKPAQASQGIEHVIVGGVPLVENGKLKTDVFPGRPIRNE